MHVMLQWNYIVEQVPPSPHLPDLDHMNPFAYFGVLQVTRVPFHVKKNLMKL